MLERVLEPEVMDTYEEASVYNDMDHAEVNRTFVADLFEAGFTGGDTLDLGTGTALIPIEICRRCEDCRIMAVDLSVGMLDLARLNIEIEGQIERIMLDRVDAKELPYPDGMFSTVLSNSIVHHIADPGPVLADAVRVLAPGGLIFFRDLARPQSDEAVAGLVQSHAAEEAEQARQMFEASLRAALTLGEICDIVQNLGLDPSTAKATSDRHWTWSVRKES